MRIAYLTGDNGVPVFGDSGASIHVRELVGAFLAQGHEVTVLAAKAGDQAAEWSGQAPRIVILPPRPPSPARNLDRQAKRQAKETLYLERGEELEARLLELHAETPFDFIYERYSLWCAAGVRAARRLGIPCVVEVNAPLLLEQSRYRELVLVADAKAVETEVLSGADALVAVSDVVRDYAVTKGADPTRCLVLSNAVDVVRFNADVRATEIPAIEQGFVIGFAGGLKPWHGIEFLLDAFTQVHAEDPDCHLLIVGDGPLRMWIEGYARGARVHDKVTVTGWRPYRDLPGLMKRMDVALAPYPDLDDFYFSPLKLFEYMGIGLPIVASAIGQIREVIDDGNTGLLARPGDATNLAALIGRVRRDPALGRSLGLAAGEQAKRNTWEDNARRVVDLARSLRRAA